MLRRQVEKSCRAASTVWTISQTDGMAASVTVEHLLGSEMGDRHL